MKELLTLTEEVDGELTDIPLLHDDEGNALSKHQMINNIREVLQAADIVTTRMGAEGQVERFGGHALRVAGAQHLTHLGFQTSLVMLLGRWGSLSILRYVQDSPLQELLEPQAEQESGPPSGAAEPAIKKLRTQAGNIKSEVSALQQQMEELTATVSSLNRAPNFVVGKKTHRPDPNEGTLPPYAWVSRCGWHYGLSRFSRSDLEANCCLKCFPPAVEEGAAVESSEEGSSSSSTE